MRIDVHEIPSGGREVKFSLADDWALAGAEAGLEGRPSVLAGVLRLSRSGTDLLIAASGTATVARPCDRCGVELVSEIRGEDRFVYRRGSDQPDTDVELDEDDLDLGWYEGPGLELELVVAELFALAMPPRITCEGACDITLEEHHDESAGHPAFAALKDLF